MLALEKHYTIGQVAEMWSLSKDTVRRLFSDDPSTIKLYSPKRRRLKSDPVLKSGSKIKREYCVLSIPESSMTRIHERLRGKAR